MGGRPALYRKRSGWFLGIGWLSQSWRPLERRALQFFIGKGSPDEPAGNTTINATWATISENVITWSDTGMLALGQTTTDKDILAAIVSVNAALIQANSQMGMDVTYGTLLNILGVL